MAEKTRPVGCVKTFLPKVIQDSEPAYSVEGLAEDSAIAGESASVVPRPVALPRLNAFKKLRSKKVFNSSFSVAIF
jgi:hypothetical protein